MRLTHLFCAATAMLGIGAAHAATLVGYAQLPAATFIAGPTSGQFGIGSNGYNGPFLNQQPVQGFSSIISNGRGGYTVLSDNGFGTQGNSADALLLVHDINIDWRTAAGGSGQVFRNTSTALSDPNRRLGFTIQADKTNYYDGAIPVDPAIRANRLLTGADLDTESFRRANDGSYYFGDEFGPFVVHT
ncbi:MAG: PEP-CTERM sorting domain-containing protein, partial [Alphaproteobacteria bacterium]